MNKMLRALAAAGFAAVLLVGLPGCPHDEYVIEMWPHGQQLERKVAVRHIEDPDHPATTQVSTDRFTDVIPDQLDGNAGRYACYPSEFGTAYFYSERIRGNDDQAGALEAQFKAVDRLIDILLGWTKQEFGKLDDYPKLAAFIDKDLRKDIKNVGVIAFMADAGRRLPPVEKLDEKKNPFATQPDNNPDLFSAGARAIQYAAERNYLAKGDLGRLVRGQKDENGEVAKDLLRNLLTRKVGLSEKAAAEVVKKAERPDVAKSFNEYVLQSPQYAQAVAEWREKQKTEKTGKAAETQPATRPEEPELNEVLFAPAFATIVPLIVLGPPDDFRFTLHLAWQPVETNGWYDEKARTVTWAFHFPKANVSVPQVCYAVWAEPNEKAQLAKFGRVGLIGEPLAEYCLWRSALSKTELAEWEALLAKLKPDADFASLLRGAKFSGKDKQMYGAEMILRAIRPPDAR